MAYLCRLARRAALLGVLCLQAAWVCAEPNNGWWWNPNESGRGFFIEQTDGAMYVGGYFYDASGRATWATSGGPAPDPYLYEGRLQTFAGGQSLFGAYRFPGSIVDIGAITIRFADDTHATLTWPGGTVEIERQIYGDVEAEAAAWFTFDSFGPHTGWWWDPDESGRGYSIEVQGSSLFLAGFMYDDAGNPLWYFGAGPMTTERHFESDLLLFSGGQTMAGPYRAPASPRNAGRISIDFSAEDRATITTSDAAAGRKSESVPKQKKQSSVQLQFPRYLFTSDDQWPGFAGDVRVADHLEGEAGTTGIFTNDEKWFFTDLVWRKVAHSDGRYIAVYHLFAGSVTHREDGHDTSDGCRWSSEDTWGFDVLYGRIFVKRDMSYTGVLELESSDNVMYKRHYFACDDPANAPPDVTVWAGTAVEIGSGSDYHVRSMSSYSSNPSPQYEPVMVGVRHLPVALTDEETLIVTWTFRGQRQ
jgi:hypothetical protein